MITIPVDAPVSVQAAFRQVGTILAQWDGGRNIDLHGRRIINAGDAHAGQDYVTQTQLQAAVGADPPPTPVTALVRDLVRAGLHDDRMALAPGGVPLNTLYYETDRAALYQAQLTAGVAFWALVMCRPLRTSATKPSDLGTDDAGFTWFDQVAGLTYRWSGSAWNYYLGSLVDTFANLPDPALADRGFLFLASDRGYQVWRKGSTAWILLEGVGGPTRDTLANITGSLTSDDAGYAFYATDFDRLYRWSGSAYADAPGQWPRKAIVDFDVAPGNGWALCDGSTVTISTATGGSTSYATRNLTATNLYRRANTSSGGTAGAATHTHAIDPPNTTSGAPSATTTVDNDLAASTVAVGSATHTHDTNIGSFTSGSGSSLPPTMDFLPYVRL